MKTEQLTSWYPIYPMEVFIFAKVWQKIITNPQMYFIWTHKSFLVMLMHAAITEVMYSSQYPSCLLWLQLFPSLSLSKNLWSHWRRHEEPLLLSVWILIEQCMDGVVLNLKHVWQFMCACTIKSEQNWFNYVIINKFVCRVNVQCLLFDHGIEYLAPKHSGVRRVCETLGRELH